MSIDSLFRLTGHSSWIAEHPTPQGVIEFIGGALLGNAPIISYDYFLRSLYDAGYTVIAIGFRFGLNHQKVAEQLLVEQDQILNSLAEVQRRVPRFWVGHSLGCKYLLLLESSGKIMDQPSLLIAPDISDTAEAVPLPWLADLLDSVGAGVTPTREQTALLLENSALFNLTALISFTDDTIAGNQHTPPERSDVALFVRELEAHRSRTLIKAELPGGHFEIAGLRASLDSEDYLIDIDPRDGFLEKRADRSLEPLALAFLAQLQSKLARLAPVDGPLPTGPLGTSGSATPGGGGGSAR
ncbi:DUF1350 family protein [Gloeobacter morelensis]|uniref:DUF1350 family protein n=1 Tax=Gloeobacter morelensis MG652769 TaxID=2781736 RepID=A0ABY3PMX3_9CYAN|nr:DUF1350 family protein [Gloeobacter morelensis]UFP94959.1 DUF1350 family protein [Gloeobacter morelensis MG652769]